MPDTPSITPPRRCTRCGDTKSAIHFGFNRRPPPELNCKACQRAYENGRYRANPELRATKSRIPARLLP